MYILVFSIGLVLLDRRAKKTIVAGIAFKNSVADDQVLFVADEENLAPELRGLMRLSLSDGPRAEIVDAYQAVLEMPVTGNHLPGLDNGFLQGEGRFRPVLQAYDFFSLADPLARLLRPFCLPKCVRGDDGQLGGESIDLSWFLQRGALLRTNFCTNLHRVE
ncbi:MAG: hypothetical protein K6U03_00035 [Firmicutes bacterium]|nr:hypothetical protein [Bacillota bacterium]